MVSKILVSILLGFSGLLIIGVIIRSIHEDLFFGSVAPMTGDKVFFGQLLGTIQGFVVAFGVFFTLILASAGIAIYTAVILGYSAAEALPFAIAVGFIPAAWWMFSGCGRFFEWIESRANKKIQRIQPTPRGSF